MSHSRSGPLGSLGGPLFSPQAAATGSISAANWPAHGSAKSARPVKFTLELPAEVHRDLVTYAEVLGRTTGRPIVDPAKLIPPMIERFMATDRGFAKARRESNHIKTGRRAGWRHA